MKKRTAKQPLKRLPKYVVPLAKEAGHCSCTHAPCRHDLAELLLVVIGNLPCDCCTTREGLKNEVVTLAP